MYTIKAKQHFFLLRLVAFCALAWCTFVASAADRGKETFEAPYSRLKYHLTNKVQTDGSYESTTELVIKINTAQGIDYGSSQTIQYINGMEDVVSLEAWTIQPDGTKNVVPSSSIRTQDEQADEAASFYSDTKVKVIIYPDVQVGSLVAYKVVMRHYSPVYPNHFFDNTYFPVDAIWNDVQLTYVIPTSMTMYTSQQGVAGGLLKTEAGFNHYRYTYNRPTAVHPQSGRVYYTDYADYVTISTFPDRVAIGRAYQETAQPKTEVTEPIRKLALQLTEGVTDERTKAKKIYEWVAVNIRYVAIALGYGRLIPHSAEEVLRNKYGDCKDQVALLEALLKAVGIASSPALLNAGNAYQLADLGVTLPLNHVIIYIPSLDLYLDSTDPFAPFGNLTFQNRDKPTVLTALNKLGRTTKMLAKENVRTSVVLIKIDENGTLFGNSRTTFQGTPEIDSRKSRFYDQNEPQAQVVKDILKRYNETGGGTIDYPDPQRIDQPYWVTSEFYLDPITNIPGRGAMRVPVGMAPGEIVWLALNKPLEKDYDYVCGSYTNDETYTIEFPQNVVVDGIPKGVQYNDETIDYVSEYSLKGRVVHVRRVLSNQIMDRSASQATISGGEHFIKFYKKMCALKFFIGEI
jgi:transglutaminase-like putative cysteine protease